MAIFPRLGGMAICFGSIANVLVLQCYCSYFAGRCAIYTSYTSVADGLCMVEVLLVTKLSTINIDTLIFDVARGKTHLCNKS